MNDIKLLGRLAQDPQLTKTQDDIAVCFATIAVSRPTSPDKTDFIDFVCFEKLAENFAKYKHKGDEIAITNGEIKSYKREGKTEQGIVALNITYLRNKVSETKQSEPSPLQTETKERSLADKVAGFF